MRLSGYSDKLLRANDMDQRGATHFRTVLALRSRLAAIILLLLLAVVLRVYHLTRSPLNGDEAFTVRYWAAPPAEVLAKLAWTEPHPFGAFFSFWVWKQLLGESEFAMRLFPLLVNILGVPALYALCRRLTHDDRLALLGALLWAINPNQIWHAQDVRNYAIWSALSLITLWLLLQATQRSRPLDWALYILVATLGLYMFFLEAVIIVVHGLYILLAQRQALRSWLIALLIIGILLIPWFGQAWALAHSGYHGTGSSADILMLFSDFFPALAFGELLTPLLGAGWLLLWLGWYGGCLLLALSGLRHRPLILLLLLLTVPTTLLLLAATRLDVFFPRYLIASTPAILLIPLTAHYGLTKARSAQGFALSIVLILPLIVGASIALAYYYSDSPEVRKAPDWYTLRDYLHTNTTDQDVVLMTSVDPQTGAADPAFEYYYRGPAQVITLPHPGIDTFQVVKESLAAYRAVWFVVVGNGAAELDHALITNGSLISDLTAGIKVRQYRAIQPKVSEIETPLDISVGGGMVAGYSLSGLRRSGGVLTVLLFWQRLPDAQLTTFVHLIGPSKADGNPLWAQEDHPPKPGRDIYTLDLASVPLGMYHIEIGLYNPATSQRIPITTASGQALGDSYQLDTVTVAP